MWMIDTVIDDTNGDITSRVSREPSRYDVQVVFGWSVQLTFIFLNGSRRIERSLVLLMSIYQIPLLRIQVIVEGHDQWLSFRDRCILDSPSRGQFSFLSFQFFCNHHEFNLNRSFSFAQIAWCSHTRSSRLKSSIVWSIARFERRPVCRRIRKWYKSSPRILKKTNKSRDPRTSDTYMSSIVNIFFRCYQISDQRIALITD